MNETETFTDGSDLVRRRRATELLTELADRLLREDADQYLSYGGLARLLERVLALPEAGLRQFERGSRPWRAPLRRMLSELGSAGELSVATRRDLCTVLRSMHCLLDCLLDPSVTPPDAGTLAVLYQPLDLAALARELADAFVPLAEERGLDYVVVAPARLPIEVDRAKLEAVVTTLLFGAFKHTPIGGRLSFVLTDAEGGEVAVLTVADGGPVDSVPSTESLLHRSKVADRNVFPTDSGPELGLASARDAVGLQGGTLSLRPNAGGPGLEIEVRLPRRAPEGAVFVRPVAPSVGLGPRVAELAARELRAEAALVTELDEADARPRLLIVEDNRSIQRVLTRAFGSEFAVVSAFDGVEGIQRAEAIRPDLILTDLMMPQMDGRTMIRAIRARPALAAVPVIVLTSRHDPEGERWLLENGVMDVVHKPFEVGEVRLRVKNLVESKRARDVLGALLDRRQSDLVKLADEVARQQHVLRSALDEVQAARSLAESASRVKSNFLRMMSHELKTPVTAMQLHLRLLEREPEVAASPRVQESLGRIRRSSRRLVTLVDTMLEWARVESGRIQLSIEVFEASTLLAEIASELGSHARQKQVPLVVQVDPQAPPLQTDRRLLGLVLVNLVARALQATEDGEVLLTAGWAASEHRLSIIDRGEPLTQEEQLELFEPFRPDHDLRWKGGSGSGLGLYVIRDIARALGARLEVEAGERGGNGIAVVLGPGTE